MLSALASAHPEGLAVNLAMGSDCCLERVISTRIISSKVSCRILDTNLSFLSLLRHTCSESFEELSDNFFSLFSFSDLFSSFPIQSSDFPKVVLPCPQLITYESVVCTAKYFLASFFLWDFFAGASCDLFVLRN